MAQATTSRFSQFLVLLGDGASPEEFEAPCGLTSRSLERTSETNSTNVPDCDDEDAPSWLENDEVSKSWSITGEGVVAEESIDSWEGWWQTGGTKNVRVSLRDRTWEGRALLTNFTINASKGQRVTHSITLTGDGILTLLSGS